jgi:alpha-tubulin suppressor-like RCC1 family protein
VIDEIMAHPATADEAAGEWFELYNNGRDPVDLDGWTIASGGDAGYTIRGPLVIGRGEYLVLGGSADAVANGGARVDHAWTDVRLGNDTGDWLALRSPHGMAVDSVDWGAPAGETAAPPPEGASLGLRPTGTDSVRLGGASSSWSPDLGVFGTGQRGSPGRRSLIGVSLVAIATGWNHTCGVDAAGQAWCWGSNARGDLGTGNTDDQKFVVPVLQAPGTRFVGIASAQGSCALDESGQVFCWGAYNPYPRALPQPDSVRFVALVGGFRFCGLTATGQTWCWDGLTAPNALATGYRFSSLAMGGSHTCGVALTGKAYCWGSNYDGQIGDGTTTYREAVTAVKMPPGVTFTAIAAGWWGTCAVATSGVAYCWGRPVEHWEQRLEPAAVTQPESVRFTSIEYGAGHVCAISATGQAYCWGGNYYGELGDGTHVDRLTPAPVRQPAGVLFSAVTASTITSCAFERGSGQPYCWGGTWAGMSLMGNGTTEPSSVPVAAGR